MNDAMKKEITITITGKAAVGKTTLALAMMEWFSSQGVDADLIDDDGGEYAIKQVHQSDRWDALKRDGKFQIKTQRVRIDGTPVVRK